MISDKKISPAKQWLFKIPIRRIDLVAYVHAQAIWNVRQRQLFVATGLQCQKERIQVDFRGQYQIFLEMFVDLSQLGRLVWISRWPVEDWVQFL